MISSLLGILDGKYPDWQNNKMVEKYRNKSALFDFYMGRLDKFIFDEYRNVDRETAESNIRRVLK